MNLHMTLRSKIFLSMILLNVFVVLMISVFYYKVAEENIKKEYAKALLDNTYTNMKNLDEVFQGVYYLSNKMSFDPNLKNLVLSIKNKENKPNVFGIVNFLQLQKQQNKVVDSVYLFIPDNEMIYTDREWSSVHSLDQKQQKFFQQYVLKYQQDHNALSPFVMEDVLSVSRKKLFSYMEPIKSNNQIIAWIFFNLDERMIYYRYIDDLRNNKPEGSLVYLENENGEPVIGEPRNSLSEELEKMIFAYNSLNPKKIKKASDFQDYLVVQSGSIFSGYQTLVLVKSDFLLNDLLILQGKIFLVSIMFICASLVLAYNMAKRVNKPIERLEKAMENVGRGEFETKIFVSGSDEISKLSQGFNTMVMHINQLIEQVIVEKTLTKQAELKALQYQITPHFIYNTLNSIRFAAVMQGAVNIGKLLECFVDLLQASSNKRGSFISLQDEIKTLQSYVLLQKFRHTELFEVKYDIPDALNSCVVPRLILQPLVENSLMHGPSEERGFCNIIIRARKKDKMLILTVEDDGKGVEISRMEDLLNGSNTGERYTHIGIHNIQERLQLYYGSQSCLRYFSDAKTFTQAILKLPIGYNCEIEYKR